MSQAPLLVCEAGEDGCPSERQAKRRETTPSSSDDDTGRTIERPETVDEEIDELEGGEPTEPEDEPAPALGPICEKLQGCCKQLEKAGYSPNTCLEIVDTKSETACSLQHRQYKDYGDCT